MNFNIADTPELARFQEEVRQWLDEHMPRYIEFPAEMEALNEAVLPLALEFRRKLAEKGWLFPAWPKEYGGGGLSLNEQIILREEFSRRTLPIVHEASHLVGAALLAMGTEEQKRRFLPLLAKGETFVWQCFTEPEAGTDLASIKLQATQDEDEFILNGQKIYSGESVPAHYLFTIGVTDPKAPRHRNLTAFMVKADSPGISMTSLKPLAGRPKYIVYYENVKVPVENMIGDLNRGWEVINVSLRVERAGWGAVLKDAFFDDLLNYCKETKRNGVPLCNDPHIRDVLVDLYLDFKVRKLLTLRNYWKISQGLPITYEAPQIALYQKELFSKFAAAVLEISGPFALVKDKRWAMLRGKMEHFQRRSLMTHGGGTNEAQKITMARALGLGRKT